jgi:hypothetical protein
MKILQAIKRNNNISNNFQFTGCGFCATGKVVRDISKECNGFTTTGTATK